MKYVIELSEEDYTMYSNDTWWLPLGLLDALRKATPIPEGHGRIIDESKITQTWWETKEELRLERLNCVNKHRYVVLRGSDAPTIVEAEKEEEE